jgi:hypothetical protein
MTVEENVESKKKSLKIQGGYGIPVWPDGQDPIIGTMEMLEDAEASDTLRAATANLHADLVVARGIAVSIFGQNWREFVMNVYDQLQEEKGFVHVEETDDEDAPDCTCHKNPHIAECPRGVWETLNP